MTCKWLVTMVIVSPLSRVNRVVNGFTPITNHLLSGVILQVPSRKLTWLAGNHHFFFHEIHLHMRVFPLSYWFSGVYCQKW